MKKIRERLYMGNVSDAVMVLSTSNHEITHLLSMLSSSLLPSVNASVSNPQQTTHGEDRPLVRKIVPWIDTPEQNILEDLESCLDFIEKGRTEGGVLVHCLAGVSRSATVTTAYLMKTEKMTLEDALSSLRSLNKIVDPNDGFLEQLKMFEEMGFTVDRSNSLYKKFRVEKMGEAYDRGERIEASHFAPNPSSASTSLDNNMLQQNIHQQQELKPFLYRCKKCRRIIASQANVLGHNPGKGDASFRKGKDGSRLLFDEKRDAECTSIFVEPMQWMMSAVQQGAVIGKLPCPYCQARLGNFNWSGVQCSCGAWVNPAFQLHKSRMDLA